MCENNYPNWFYLTTNSSQTMEKIAVSNQNKVSLFYSTCHDELDLISLTSDPRSCEFTIHATPNHW